jgi:hypothetical protein
MSQRVYCVVVLSANQFRRRRGSEAILAPVPGHRNGSRNRFRR